MARKRYTAEQIIGHLRQAEIRISEGKTVGEVSRELGVSEQTYYRWFRGAAGGTIGVESEVGRPSVGAAAMLGFGWAAADTLTIITGGSLNGQPDSTNTR